jgi:hypothetical protein
MKIHVTNRSYGIAAKALLKPGEELPIAFKRLQLAYNIFGIDYAMSTPGFVIDFKSRADAIMFLLKFA